MLPALRLAIQTVMTRDFFDPTPEQQKVVLVEASTLREAERLIESCEQCNPKDAEIPLAGRSPMQSLAAALQLIQHLIHPETPRLLARRELLERGEEHPDDLLCRYESPQLVGKPAEGHLRFG